MPLVADRKALAVLQGKVFAQIFAPERHTTVRAWVPRCASGEDAFALAMLLTTHVESNRLSNDLRVIASDTDSDLLRKARSGVYPRAVFDEFSAAGLERFFHEEDGALQVIKRIRDCLLFSTHDPLSDPPFPRLDLVFAGTLFTDTSSEDRAELAQTLHYALVPRGFLLLGSRKVPQGVEALFSVFDRTCGIFQRRDEPAALPVHRHFGSLRVPTPPPTNAAKRNSERPGPGGAVERLILQTYAPPCVVVGEDHQIVYSLGKVSRFFQPPHGVPTMDLLMMAKPELREPLLGLLRAPLQENETIRVGGIQLSEHGSSIEVAIDVHALTEGNNSLRAFVFSEQSKQQPARAEVPSARASRAKAAAQSEQVGSDERSEHEELVSYNEELMSFNEELESANDELQASQEQLQSVNEELETVNGELRMNLAELDRVNGDLHNLMENTQIVALFLDKDLRIRIFTPAARDLFRFIAADRGRPLSDIAPRFRYPELQSELAHVLRTRTVREAQVQAPSRWYMMRIMPYQSISGEVDGVVLTFNDITELKLADLEVQRLSGALEKQLVWLRTLVDVVPVGIGFHDVGSDEVRFNRSAVELVSAAKPAGQVEGGLNLAWRLGEAPSAAKLDLWGALTSPHVVSGLEVQLDGDGEQGRHALVHAAPLYDVNGAPYAKVSGLLDITEIKRERERARSREQQQAVIADLGLRALAARDLDVFLIETLPLICSVIDADVCDLTRLSDDGKSLELVARWPVAASESSSEPVSAGGSAARALEQTDPIVFSSQQGLPADWPERLRDEGVKVGARVAIRAEESAHPFGLLGVYRRRPRDFREELVFLQTVANVLTGAIHRKAMEQGRIRENEAAARRDSERQMQRHERLASLGTFATGIAHELNNPLSNIVLSADYAAKTPDASRRVKLLDAIHDNALRCGRIVESVLRFARDEATEKWPTDLNPLAHHAAEQVVSYVGAHKLNVTFELVEPSPCLRCNPTEIEQVFVNLLRNAAQAHPEQCHVRIRSEINGKDVRISVADDGPGIAPSDLERVFDPFYSTQRAAGGTGLGLSITHRILATHGGSIRATSTKGTGANFELRLPLAQ